MSPPLDRRVYALPQGSTVTVIGNRRLVAVTARYLDAHLAVAAASDDGWTVCSKPQPSRHPTGARVEAFGEVYRIARLTDGDMVIAHAGAPDQHWQSASRFVQIDAPAGAYGYATAQSTYAAVRRIELLKAAPAHMTVLHAAAVSIAGHGVLICGRKGAGKTTLALALLGRGAAYVSSDRTIVWTDRDGPAASGWVGTFRLDSPSLSLALDREQSRDADRYLRDHRRAGRYWHAGKCRFPPADLLDICGAKPAYRVVPRLLIELDPSQAETPAGLRVEPLTRAMVLETWRAHAVAGDDRLVPGVTPPARSAPPAGLTGVRLVGRRPPGEMAERIEQLAAGLAPCA